MKKGFYGKEGTGLLFVEDFVVQDGIITSPIVVDGRFTWQQSFLEEELRNGGPQDLTEEQINTYALMPEEARKHLRDIIEAYKPRMNQESRLYAGFIHSVFAKAIMEQQLKMVE